jgi:flagellar biogenesis protein FliO
LQREGRITVLELASLGRVILSFAFVIGLMLSLSWLAKKMKLPERLTRAGYGRDMTKHELAVEETLFLDPRHKMLIVRRGTKRHVLVVAQQGNVTPLLIETYEGSHNTSEQGEESYAQTIS